jgi:hypothetical protein
VIDMWPEIPAVCYEKDLIRLQIIDSKRQLQKLRKAGAFPIPELPKLDRRHRYSRRDVIAFLERERTA